ncbi:CaiB/BaiF CoA transferase family protein [Novosphingobium album (ex Liu et al. 2023)]|uniref:CaiB/BaiF CoA-transferase family protein n=1 Tax=Novosphingobium album (ex Liu et al. 2023) TaxID=3031130 RepID=A0ABT5WRE7_9SPHN|nr:CaiB/BaiF CoA-transferase family protein [Novosphingobium album (ex Liu et al. 2023)]MDE8652424.1 CaiB/BaiF CoA-transferase family protein [Novosphingobium album (ex Liu et al. 2023)]
MTVNDAHNAKPLTGLRVLELGAYISGPYCGALLAALGADVVKLEPVRSGDPFRRGSGNRDAYFLQYNAGKRSISLNLKSPEGVALVKALLPRFDVLLENSRPGKVEALGLGADACREINPGLVYASISGFGPGGPLRDRPAYDSIGQSIAGNYSLMNDPDKIQLTGGAIADLITGITATCGVLAGLVGRNQATDGRGTIVQTSLMEAMSSITIDAVSNYFERGVSPTRQSRHGQAQAYCVTASDGKAITLHLSVSEKFWANVARTIGREDLVSDPRFATYRQRLANYTELETILKAEFLKRGSAQWQDALLAADVPFAPVNTIEDVVFHPQTEWLGQLEPERDGLALVRPAFTFDGTRPSRAFDAPLVGEHSCEIAGEVLSRDQIQRLIEAGVLYDASENATNAPP